MPAIQTTILRPAATTGPSLFEGDGNALVFDALLSESPSDSVEVTEHPVEEGIPITDNSQDLPSQLSMTVLITNSPLNPVDQFINRDFELYRRLLNILRAKEPVTVSTPMRTYSNMILQEVSPVRENRQSIQINLTFKEVRFANQEVVTIPPEVLAPSTRRGGQTKRDAGRQPGNEVGTPNQPNNPDTPPAPEKDAVEEKESTKLKDLVLGT